MRNLTENNLGQTFANIIQSQSPIQKGSARQSKQQGESVAVKLNQNIPGSPSVVRAIALNPIQVGANNVNLIRLPEPINGNQWGAVSTTSNQTRSSNSEVNVSHTPPPSGSRKVKVEIKIGYTGKKS